MGLGSALLLSALIAVFFINLVLFYAKSTDNLEYLSFGFQGALAFLESFPYLWMLLGILFIFIACYLIKKYDISYKCGTLSPNIGDKIDCHVNNKNKMGIIAYIRIDDEFKTSDNNFDNSPLIIIIPNDIINGGSLNINDINIEQKLKIEILGTRIKYRNEKIPKTNAR